MDVLRFNEDNFIGDDELADTSGRIDKRRGDMALTFFKSKLGRAESRPFVKLEQWKKHRWSALKPQPYSDAVSAVILIVVIILVIFSGGYDMGG